MEATVMQGLYVNLPETDVKFFKELMKKMGWTVETKSSMLDKYIASRPTNVDLTDEDIMAEITAVRYDK